MAHFAVVEDEQSYRSQLQAYIEKYKKEHDETFQITMFENNLDIYDGVFMPTKSDKIYHGYGIKSMRYVAEKYGGILSIQIKEHWFWLGVLIPVTK